MVTVNTGAAQHPVGKITAGSEVFQACVVEFMYGDADPFVICLCVIVGQRGPRAFAGFLNHHVTPALRSFTDNDICGHRAHHVTASPPPLDAARKVHQTPAFGISWHTRCQRPPDISTQALICR